MNKLIFAFILFVGLCIVANNAFSKTNNRVSVGEQDFQAKQLTEPLSLSVACTYVKCFGGNDGSASASASGGTPPYSYVWNDPNAQTTSIAPGLKAGVYTCKVTDFAGNTATASISINEPDAMDASIVINDVTSYGGSDGSIIFSNPKGSSGSYEYSVNGTQWSSNSVVGNLKAGIYSVQIRDANVNSCVSIKGNYELREQVKISATVLFLNVSCFGANDGSIRLSNVNNGIPPYAFSINGGFSWSNSNYFDGLAPGVYTVAISDSKNSVTVVGNITIAEPAQINATISATVETFAGAKDGTITITNQTGGSGSYEYSIDGITWTTVNKFTGIASGNYTIYVRDTNSISCQISFVTTIQPSGQLIANVTASNVKCFGNKDGSIIITDATGATSFEYSIDGGVSWQLNTGAFNGLAAGAYDVKIRDANKTANTVSLGTIKITEPTKLQAMFSNYIAPLCAGTSGSYTISASGGTPPYTGTGDFVLPSGIIKTHIVYDKNGCTVSQYISMPNPSPIIATAVVNPPNYCSASGTIVVSATGGTGQLKGTGTYFVEGGNSYNIKVTDANGCSSNILSGTMPNAVNSASMTITSTVITEIDFQKPQLGAIDIQVSGGTESYTYLWSNGATTKDLHDLQNGGTYSVTVTDANGCSLSKSFALPTPNYPPVAKAGPDQIVYEGVTVTLDGSGSTDANQDQLSYVWTAPKGILLSNANTSRPTFLAPEVKHDSIVSFTLVVNDGKINSAPSEVKVAIQNVIKVGFETVGLSAIKIYPNPTTGILRIEGLSSNRRNVIEIFTTDGKVIRRQTSNLESEAIDISHEISGVYLLVINNQPYKILKE